MSWFLATRYTARSRDVYRALGLVAVVCLLADAAAARELHIQFEGSTEYDSNVFNAEQDTIADFVFRSGPRFELRDEEGRFQYRLHYQPIYEAFADLEGINSWDHLSDLLVSYQLTPRTQIFGSASFNRMKSIRSQRQAFVDLTPDSNDGDIQVGGARDPNIVVSFSNERRKEWKVEFGVRRRLSSRMLGEASVSHFRSTTEQLGVTGSQSRSFRGQLQYLYSPRNTFIGSLDVTRTDLTTSTVRWLPALGWTHNFDARFQMSMFVGPQITRPDEPHPTVFVSGASRFPVSVTATDAFLFTTTGCPTVEGFPILSSECEQGLSLRFLEDSSVLLGNPPGAVNEAISDELTDLARIGFRRPPGGETSVDPVGSLEIVKAWDEWTMRLLLQRVESGSETLGGSVDESRLAWLVTWQPTRRWFFIGQADLRRQTIEDTIFVPQIALSLADVNIGSNLQVFGVAQRAGLVFDEFDTELAITTLILSLRAERRITERLTAFFNLTFVRQSVTSEIFESEAGLIPESRTTSYFNAWRPSVGFVYRFDPIRL